MLAEFAMQIVEEMLKENHWVAWSDMGYWCVFCGAGADLVHATGTYVCEHDHCCPLYHYLELKREEA